MAGLNATAPDLRSAPPDIPHREFEERRRRAVAAASERGLAALLVWSRGGPSVDWYGDVLYLSGHHSPIGQIPDEPGWSGRSHSALILPVDDEPVLVVDLPDYAEERISVADVRTTVHVPTATADVLREKGLDAEKLGLVARETLLLRAYRLMTERLGHELDLEPADDIVQDLRMVKSPAELEVVRYAASVGTRWMSTMMEAAVEGHTEGDLVGSGLRYFAARGGRVYDVAVSSGPNSLRFQRVGLPPSWDSVRRLEKGDIVHVDAWGPVYGYYTDLVRSTVVGRQASSAQKEVLQGAITLVEHILDGIRPGAVVGALYDRGAAWMTENEFGEHQSRDSGTYFGELWPAFGHGIGLGLESPWIAEGNATILQPNMVLAVETLVGREGVGAAGFEQNVLVTEDGHEVLTSTCPSSWWE